MLSRQSVAYRQVLGEHLTPLSVGTQTAYGQMVAAMQAAGTDVTTASSRAILAMNGLLMRQATMVSFVNLFRMLGVLFLSVILLVAVMKRPPVGRGPGPVAH